MRPKVGTFAHRTGDLRRDGLLQLLPLGRRRAERRRPAALGDARGGRPDHGDGRRATACPPAARSPSTATPFAADVTARLRAHPLITVVEDEVAGLPDDGHWIIATGPLTSAALAEAIRAADRRRRARLLRRHRADRPCRHHRHVHGLVPVALRQGRDRGGADGLHQLPDDRDQYEAFIDALLAAEKTEFHEGETAGYFDGCLPIEVMAERGRETLRFGPMKPVGLTNAHEPGREALCRRPAAPRQRARHALQHRRLPDQDEVRRADRCVPHDPRPRERRASRGSAASTATPSSTRRRCSTTRCG